MFREEIEKIEIKERERAARAFQLEQNRLKGLRGLGQKRTTLIERQSINFQEPQDVRFQLNEALVDIDSKGLLTGYSEEILGRPADITHNEDIRMMEVGEKAQLVYFVSDVLNLHIEKDGRVLESVSINAFGLVDDVIMYCLGRRVFYLGDPNTDRESINSFPRVSTTEPQAREKIINFLAQDALARQKRYSF